MAQENSSNKKPGFFRRRYEGAKEVVRTGLAFNILRDATKMFWDIGASLFRKRVIVPETFDQATRRLNLSDKDLQERIKNLKIEIAIFSLSAGIIFAYTIYLGMTDAGFFAVVIALLVTSTLIACALKSHFWLFQIKNKKLGCTFQEWVNSTIKGAH